MIADRGQPPWPYRQILATGGAGYLGTNLIRRLTSRLEEASCRVRILSRRPPAAGDPGPAVAIERVIGDVRQPEIWDPLLRGVDLVYHLAAQTSVYTAEQDPIADQEINVTGTLRLLEAGRRSGAAPVIVMAGTATQVGLTAGLPVDEGRTDDPLTVYDMHKAMAERYLGYYVRAGHLRGATLRLANIYGPGPLSGSADRGVLNVMIRRALAGETLSVYGTGRHLRDYVYVDDAADAFIAAASCIDEINGRYFLIGSGEGCTIADAVALVAERAGHRTGKSVKVVHVDPPRPPSSIESRDFVADSGRFSKATGWRATVSLKEGIDRTIDALLEEGAPRA